MNVDNVVRLGVLGADDSVAVIKNVARSFSELELIPLVYWEEADIPEVVKSHLGTVDAWLCSGQVPYAILMEYLDTQTPAFYTRHSGEGLYRVVLHWVHEHGLRISDISFDTLSTDVLRAWLDEVGIDTPFYLKHYDGSISSDELVQFHRALWVQGKTKLAVTCLQSAAVKLNALGVRAVHVTPTPSEVKQVLETVIRTHELLASRDTPIAVQRIRRTAAVQEGVFGTAMTRYARSLSGAAQQMNAWQWQVFAHRAAVSECTYDFTAVPPWTEWTGLPIAAVNGGIGVGKSIREAEERAQLALEQALLCGPGQWGAAVQGNRVLCPLGGERTVPYTYGREALQNLGRQLPLSALTLTRLVSVLHHRRSTRITAHELAYYLHIEPRSARRILLTLEAHGMAHVVGEDTTHVRGRPRKIYDICLPHP